MDEELLQAIREIIREELKETNERLANVETVAQKTDATIDRGINALKNKPGFGAILKLMQGKKSGENGDE